MWGWERQPRTSPFCRGRSPCPQSEWVGGQEATMGEQPGVLGAAPGEQWLRCRGWRSTGQSAGPREGKPRPFQECSAQAWAGGGHREECLGVEGLWSPWGWYGFVQTHHADPGCWAVCLRLGLGDPAVGLSKGLTFIHTHPPAVPDVSVSRSIPPLGAVSPTLIRWTHT